MRTSLILLFCCTFYYAQAQVLSCPPNIDFEQGNYSNWNYYTGTCCPISTNFNSGPLANRHVITSGTATDPYGGFPIVSPGGGGYSLKLGNSSTGSQAERARYYVHVPANVNNYSLIYQYAVVFEDPSHSPSEQPRFEVNAYDSATNVMLPCAQFTYVSSAGLPGFLLSPLSTFSNPIYYKPWTIASLNLSGLAGHTVIVDFSSGDCDLGGHFGYGYIDISCGLFQIQSVICNASPTLTMNAPPGFAGYAWYDSNYVNLIDTGQNITIPTPPQNSVYHLVLSPYVGFGCTDTLHTLVTVSNISMTSSNDTTVCKYSSLPLFALASGTNTTFTYQWSPGTNLSCSTCSNPILQALAPASYTVTASDQYGCLSTDTVNVQVMDFDSIINVSVCEGNTYNGYGVSGTYIDTFLAVNGCDSLHILNLTVIPKDSMITNATICAGDTFLGHTVAGTYIDTFTNINGCDSIVILNLNVNPNPTSILNQTICSGQSLFGYTTPGTYYDTLTASTGCDSIRQLNLIVMPPDSTVMYNTICDGQQYLGYTSTGTFVDSFLNSVGCDSTRILHLIVNPSYHLINALSKCKDTLLYYQGQPITTAGVYSFASQTTLGCDSNIELHVNYFPDLHPAIPDTTLCPGETLSVNVNNFSSYVWSTGATTPSIQVDQAGLYWVKLTDQNGCHYIDSFQLNLNPEPSVHIAASTQQLCKLDMLSMKGNGADHYQWYVDNLNNPVSSADTLTLSLTQNTMVYLKGWNAYQCYEIDSVQIGLIDCCEDVIMPTAFSPNKDGINDEFRPVNTIRYKEYLFQVYSRWGEKIFEIKNSPFGWDGNYKNEPCEIGTYFYILKIDCGDGRKYFKKGDFSLIR